MRKTNTKDENYNVLLLINDAITLAKLLINDESIEFKQEISNIPVNLYGNKSNMRQAIVDLILNTSKHIEESKIKLNFFVKEEKKQILFIATATSSGNTFSLCIPQKEATSTQNKVLIVDDDIMNIKIFKRLLKGIDIEIDSTLSGKECLNKIKTNNYDAIFLDHLMPEMNGLELFNKIRLNVLYEKIPIIALTGNSDSDAKKFYISKGFNDYLQKPISRTKLLKMLAKYLPETFTINLDINPSEKEEIQKDNLNFKYLNFTKGMKYAGNDPEIYKKILNVYLETGKQKIKHIEKAYENEDWENYIILIHTLKGTSAGIGADELSKMLRNIEISGKINDIEYIKDNHQYALNLYKEILKNIKENITKKNIQQKIEKHKITQDELINKIQDLKSNIHLFYVEETLDIIKELKMCIYRGNDLGEKVTPILSNLIENYKLDEAENTIDMIRERLNIKN